MELTIQKTFFETGGFGFQYVVWLLVTNLHCKTEKNNSATEQQYAGLKQDNRICRHGNMQGIVIRIIYETFIQDRHG